MKGIFLLAGLLASFGVSAEIDGWRYRSADTVSLEVANEGVLARTTEGYLQVYSSRVLRRDPQGRVLDVHRADPASGDYRASVLPLEDGGWLSVHAINSSTCAVQRFDRRAERLWLSELARQGGDCERVGLFTDAGGGWLLSAPGAQDRARRLLRLREDGELIALELAAAGLAGIHVLRQRADGSFDLALHDAQGLQMARLVEREVIDVRRIESFQTLYSRQTVSARGDVWVTARGVDGDAGDSLLAFDAEGRRLMRLRLDLAANVRVHELSMVGEDTVAILTRDLDARVYELRIVDRQGSELARLRPPGTPNGFAAAPALRPAPALGVVALDDNPSARQMGYDAQGREVPTPIELGGRAEAAKWPRLSITESGSFGVPSWGASAEHVDVVVGRIGARIRTIDAQGRGNEGVQLRSEFFSRVYPMSVVSNATRVCAGPVSYQQIFEFVTSQAVCLDRASGQRIYDASFELAGVGPLINLGPLSVLALDAEQRVLSLVAPTDSLTPDLKLLRISADGRSGRLTKLADLPARPERRGQRDWAASLQPSGDVVFAQPHPQGGVFLLVSRGEAVPLQVRLATDANAQVQAVLDRGSRGVALSVAVLVGAVQRDELWLVDVAGTLTQRHELGSGAPLPVQALLREVDGELLLAHATQPGSSTSVLRTRQTQGRINAATGAWRWRRSEERVRGDVLVDLQLAGARGLVLSQRAGQPRLEQVDLATGQSLEVRSLRCPNSLSCRPRGLVVDADNHARLIAEVSDAELGLQVEVVKFPLAEPARPGVQTLGGLWFAPESSGQGLVLGLMPGAQALLGGWFSYAEAGVNRNADQRWYALESRYVAGATSLSVDILRAGQGAFATAGAQRVERIGGGELYLRGCNEAVFRYRFTGGEESGLAGEIPLLRLGPGPGECSQPAQPRADRGGFSSLQSGPWYDPARDGQGLVLEVLPATASSAGLLSAGWFTFDPQGAADDPHAQHWFLVQGEIPLQANGEVELPIYNAIGGKLDTGSTRNVRELGRARIRMQGCDAANLEYAFAAGREAGAYAGRSGRIELWRLGGCERP
jgi:hypothetical protein